MKNRKVLFILGMHRSGTSAMTRLVNLMGAGLPHNLMPANADNKNGYWESKDIAYINNQLLKQARTSWPGIQDITSKWLNSSEVIEHKNAAISLIESLFNNLKNECLVIKDPRICRLLPFWHSVMDSLNISYDHVFIFRNPEEVFLSFKKRFDTPEFKPAAIIHREKINLLWLRYVLDAEYFSKGKNRHYIDYKDLVNNPIDEINALAKYLSNFSSDFNIEVPETLYQFISKNQPPNQRKPEKIPDKIPDKLKLSFQVYELLKNKTERKSDLTALKIDKIREVMNDTIDSYRSLLPTSPKNLHDLQPWFSEVTDLVLWQLKSSQLTKSHVLFLTGAPLSRGHTYRVEHHALALKKAGFKVSCYSLEDNFSLEEMKHLKAVVVFRALWNDKLKNIYKFCDEHNICKIFDVDDLVFKPEVMTLKNWDYLRLLNETERQKWHNQFVSYLTTVSHSDHVIVPTETLANEAQLLNKSTSVLINSLSQKMIEISQTIVTSDALKPSKKDGFIRLGYASGTPTHQKDFAEVSSVIAQLMSEHSHLKFIVVGCLILSEFPELMIYENRIELRPIVDHMDLFFEYSQFDINIAPLQSNNIFCECKSQLKYLDAGLVEVPTVASATEPFVNSIHHGLTGYIAQNDEQWHKHLKHLIENQSVRIKIGQCAKAHTIARFGPKINNEIVSAEFSHIIDKHGLTLNEK